MPVFIIAEAGVNHNGDPDMAYRLIEAAVESGANAVKFQTFRAESLVTKTAPKASYQKKSGQQNESQIEMLSKLELEYDIFVDLKKYSEKIGIQFMSTAFDSESLSFLSNELEVDPLKIPSGEITNGPFLLEHAETGGNLILSTGMATFDEIEQALAVLAFGFLDKKTNPSKKAFERAFDSQSGQNILKEKVTLLHCTTQYPAPFGSINLNSMTTLRNKFGLRVGYSDHSLGIYVPCAATAMGARVIEKHFTLDRTLPGPDHSASLEPAELSNMVEGIRAVERALGDSGKPVLEVEAANRKIVRRGLIATKEILQGDRFTKDNLGIKRPEYGCSPMDYWAILGTQATQNYLVDDPILCLEKKNQS